MPACSDEFLARVTEGVVHGVYKVITQSVFGVTQRVEVNGHFETVSQGRIRTSGSSQMTGAFHQMPTTVGYSECNVNDTPNLGRYLASLEMVLLPSTTSNCGSYHLLDEWGIMNYMTQEQVIN